MIENQIKSSIPFQFTIERRNGTTMDSEFYQMLFHPKRIRSCNYDLHCSLCGQRISGYGISADPVITMPRAQCCDDCYRKTVIPALIHEQIRIHNQLIQLNKNRKDIEENALYSSESENNHNQQTPCNK